MIKINTIEDFLSKEIQNIFQALNSNFGINFVAVFDLKDKNLIALYACQNLIVPDEQNRKTFFIKGKLINDFSTIIQGGGAVITGKSDIKQIIDNYPVSLHTYSENMFGFISLGIQGY